MQNEYFNKLLACLLIVGKLLYLLFLKQTKTKAKTNDSSKWNEFKKMLKDTEKTIPQKIIDEMIDYLYSNGLIIKKKN